MKKVSSPTIPAPSLWRPVALVALVLNVALVIWIWRHPSPTSEATPPSPIPAAPAKLVERPVVNSAYAALGSFMAENNRIADLGWSEKQFSEFLSGMRASYEGRGLPLDDDAKKLRDSISKRVQSMLAQEQPNPVEDYFRMLRDKEGAKRTESGLHYRITEEGEGPHPKATDEVVLSFSARQPDGKELPQLGRARVRIVVGDLLPGLAEGVQLLSVGGKALVYVPASLSFSPADWPAEVPKEMPLAFFVELHEIGPARP